MDSDALTLVERWSAEQACRDLVIRGAALIDACDYEAFAALFLDDGELVRPGAASVRGRAAIVTAYRARPPDRMTRHLISNSLVTLTGPNEARAQSHVLLWSSSSNHAVGAFGRVADPRQVIGELDDRLAQTAEGWRIARREARFVLFRET